MKRGEVYWAELVPRSGAEQTGGRPVIVVSHDGFNGAPNWRSIVVVPVSTSATQARRGVTTPLLPAGSASLQQASFAICHQVTTLDRAKLLTRLGELTPDLMRDVEEGLKAALDIE